MGIALFYEAVFVLGASLINRRDMTLHIIEF